jgi:hypothetical protein
MEILKVLTQLNARAKAQIQAGDLDLAKETLREAIDYYLRSKSNPELLQPDLHPAVSAHMNMLHECQVQITALLLHQVGAKYKSMGMQELDEAMHVEGEAMIERASMLLKLRRTLSGQDQPPGSNSVDGAAPPSSSSSSPVLYGSSATVK